MKSTLTLALALAIIAPSASSANGFLHSPPTILGGVVPSGPAILSIRNIQTVVPPGGNDRFQVPFQTFPLIQPIFPINTINSSLTVYPQGYGVFTDGLGNRSFIPRGSSLLRNRGYQESRPQVAPPAPPPPAPTREPEPVAVAPEAPERRQSAPIPSNPSELEADATIEGILRQEIEDRPDLRASVVLYDVVGRRKAEYHSPGEYYPGSIARLPVLVGTARELARGALDANRRIELVPSSDDTLSRKMGELVSVNELLQRMIRRGDLNATNALIDHVGFASINEAVAAVDLKETILGRRFNDPRTASGQLANKLPTVDAATLLYKVLRKDMPERGMASRMLDLLSRHTTSPGIPRLLRERPGTQVWGLTASARLKNGREVANDVAIVTTGGHAYVIAIYTDAPSDQGSFIGELAVRLHDALSQHRAQGD